LSRIFAENFHFFNERDENMNNSLFNRVVELCKEKGISQRKLQEELEMASGALSKWKISMPNAALLQKVADYFNVSTDYLTGRTNYRNNEHMLQVFDQKYKPDLDNTEIPYDKCIQTEEGIVLATPKYIDPDTRIIAEAIMTNDKLKDIFQHLTSMSESKIDAIYNMVKAMN
jgi:transcriptional regulator with XRE-family HTH domain